MRTSIIKVLVAFNMSVRELKEEVKNGRINKFALKNPDYLQNRLQGEVWLGNRVIYRPMLNTWTKS